MGFYYTQHDYKRKFKVLRIIYKLSKTNKEMGRKKLGTVGIYRNVMPHHIDKIDRYIKYLKDEDRKQKGDLYDGMTINHIDGDITNNHIDNLEQITQSENIHNTYAKNKWSKLLKKYGNIHFISVYR